ncbi:hypothetical protein EIP86_004768 [Pleurotus ostreatoroseus]|nr:hypothetical protein EIP86_004768 [Pleurotus ostreatoroseus]
MDSTQTKQTSNTNPWKEIERTVRTVDEEKVKDCTADVDALLVFAGLYSAVLTAFLIDSYKTLQYDPTQDYLRQIAAQTSGYTLTNSHMNATLSFQPPTFQAADSAIRVNVCWFASLLLSLSSASFGILVKQWLREFLAIPYISPQERIRIRDARVQGLEIWNLFEIASLLPVLLQISLALFFVGLCFFTAAVHPSVGTTTLLLVCCWAFFFCLSVIAPLVSPRCPYKMTALKAASRHVRPYIRSLLQCIPLQLALSWLTSAASSVVIFIGLGVNRLYNEVSRYFLKRNSSHEPGPASFSSVPVPETVNHAPKPGDRVGFSDDRINLLILRQVLPSVFDDSASSSQDIYQDGIEDQVNKEDHNSTEDHDSTEDRGTTLVESRTPSIARASKHSLLSEEEDDLRSIVDNDLIVFRHIDSSFLDDNLLSLMQQSLQLQPRPLNDTLNFVIIIFKSRLGSYPVKSSAQSDLPDSILWPWTLSRMARAAMAGILADSVVYELSYRRPRRWRMLSKTDSVWSTCLALIILLVTPHEIPSPVSRLIQALAQDVLKGRICRNPLDVFSYQMRTLAQHDASWPVRSLMLLAQSLELLRAEDAAHCLAYVTHTSFIAPDGHPIEDIYQRFLGRAGSNTLASDGDVILPSAQSIVTLLEAARVILHRYTLEQTDTVVQFSPSIEGLIAFVLDAIPVIRETLFSNDLRESLTTTALDEHGLDRALTDLFTTPNTTQALLHFFLYRPRHLPTPNNPSYHDKSFRNLMCNVNCSLHIDSIQLYLVLFMVDANTPGIETLHVVAHVLSRL